MDIPKLQLEVFEKTGIRLDSADPLFALVALNEAVISELLCSAQEEWKHNSAELDAKILCLSKIYNQIMDASKDLASRVNQAHLAAALKAAADARAEIFNVARNAQNVAYNARPPADRSAGDGDSKTTLFERWAIAIVQAFIGGMVAASTVLVVMAVQ